jgi:hypothetical protein
MIGVSEEEEMLRDPNARTQQIKTMMIRSNPMMASMGSPGIFLFSEHGRRL